MIKRSMRKQPRHFLKLLSYTKMFKTSLMHPIRFFLEKYEAAAEHFMKAAELAFSKGYDRFGVSALEYARDCYQRLGDQKKTDELQLKIDEIKRRLSTSF